MKKSILFFLVYFALLTSFGQITIADAVGQVAEPLLNQDKGAANSSSPHEQLDLAVGVLPVPFMETNHVAIGLQQSGLFKKVAMFSSREDVQDQELDLLVETVTRGLRGLRINVYQIYSKEILLSTEFVCGIRGYRAYPECVEQRAAELICEAFQKSKPLYARVISERDEFRKKKAEILSMKTSTGALHTEQTSDIDDLPAWKAKSNKSAFAIIIGIENYRQKLPKADFATGDAKVVTEYLTKAMGYPEENVITLINEYASKSDFEKYIEEWLPKNIEPNSSVFIYYSGHGAPNPKTGDAFLVPYDGDPNFIEKTGYPLKKLYENLSKLQAKEIIVVLDSCFSGAGGRSVLAQGSRPLVMNLQTTLTPAKNMIIMAASSGNETSSTYNEKGHGLFTYFMLKGIKNEDVVKPDGSIKMDDLFGYIKPQVERVARKQYNNEQTPQLIGGTKKSQPM